MKRTQSGFTLIELLVTISIIAMLATLFSPAIKNSLKKAESVKCAANLRSIGTAVQLAVQDNGNRYPTIEPMPSVGVYGDGDGAGTLYEVLSPYGITMETLRCDSDIKGPNYFAKEGASYMWRPLVDEELASSPKIYHPRRGEITPSPSRLPLCADYKNVHSGRVNCLMADGRVRMF